MEVNMAMQLKACGRKMMETRWISRKERGNIMFSKIPIFISTNPSLTNPQDLKQFYKICNHSSNRFLPLNSDGKVAEAVDLKMLRVVLSHSSIFVSVFCNLLEQQKDRSSMGLPLPFVSLSDAQLVGFGHVVSDFRIDYYHL